MKKTRQNFFPKIFLLVFFLTFSILFVQQAFAASTGLVPCGLEGKADCTLCHLVVGLQTIYTYLLAIFGTAATLTIVIVGFRYIISGGSKKRMEEAKSAMKYALTGILLALTAWLIINVTLNAVGFTNAGSWYTFTCDTTQSIATGDLSTGVTLSGGGSSKSSGTGCDAIVSNVRAMEGWTYTQDSRRMSDGYGDCSSTTSRAYTRAGCKNPGNSTAEMYANASDFSGDTSTLKAGDALVWNTQVWNSKTNKFESRGHVGIITEDGGTKIMGASSKNGIKENSGGAASIMNQATRYGATLRVIKASDYCPESSCK